jgi:hypothetical protein
MFTAADNDRASPWSSGRRAAAKAFRGRPSASASHPIRTPEPEWVEIIGVVAHQRVTTLAEAGREQVYVTDGFLNFGGARKWALRTAGDPATLAAAVRTTVAAIDPQFLVAEVTPFEDLVRRASSGTRFQLLLVSILAAVAAVLVAVGLAASVHDVRQRTAEIGAWRRRLPSGTWPGREARSAQRDRHGRRPPARRVDAARAACWWASNDRPGDTAKPRSSWSSPRLGVAPPAGPPRRSDALRGNDLRRHEARIETARSPTSVDRCALFYITEASP